MAHARPDPRVAMYRQDIQFPAKDAQLREDVHALGVLVGDILREQSGDALFELVEGDRVAAIRRREADSDDIGELSARTAGREPAQALDLVRAFSTWFQVVNLAEKVQRVRRRRQYLNDTEHPQPGGVEAALVRLAKEGHGLDSAKALLERITIYPVFTAHPTESTRRTILRKQQRVADFLLRSRDPAVSPAERARTWEMIRIELTSGWQTEEHARERLTVADEREHVLFYLAEILYRIVPGFYEELAAALAKVYATPVAPAGLPAMLRFGSWVGGDMDGHEDVHAKTIRETLHRQHRVVVNNYYADVQRLAGQLSQSAGRVPVSKTLEERSRAYALLVPAAQGASPARHDRMPYRVYCGQIGERLRATYEGLPGHYEGVAQFESDVAVMADSLARHKGARAGLLYVERLLRRVRTFGFHLATLDVRQHAEVHHKVLAQGLGDPGWCERSARERLERLTLALERDAGPRGVFDAVGRRTLAVFEALSNCRHRYGRAAIGNYVVSGASDADDVLGVLLLARWAEMVDKKTGQVQLDVAPLFESVSALAEAPSVLARLLATPSYRRHLEGRGQRQTVMIGYSDSNKESGFAASRWALHRAQAVLADQLCAAGIKMTVFHGRGGAASRGGGRLAALLSGAPPVACDGMLRATEQGEAVDLGYGLPPLALRTLEQACASMSLVLAGDAREPDDPTVRAAMELLATRSRAVYRELVHEDPGFYDYFRAATPIDVIERMQIGSRPAIRPGKSGVEAVRAIPWGFAWSQCRHVLPGWYGLGSGLLAVEKGFGSELLARLVREWPYFAGLIDVAEGSLAKADLSIAAGYAALAGPDGERHFEKIRAEFARAEDAVLKLRGEKRLLDGEPTLQRAVQLRNPYTDPMHLMQIDLLKRWRERGRDDRPIFEALLASITGIAQGLQGTG
jgi:phosphoenolpyruvate carboxylase